MENAIALYAWRQTASSYTLEDVLSFCKKYGKEWEFQLELSDSGYERYQGWISLTKKRRKNEILSVVKKSGDRLFEYFEPATSPDIKFYCKKHDTRISGPWSSEIKEAYIPIQYRDKLESLYPFQQTIFNSASKFNDRDINVVVCNKGCKGKSTIAHLCRLFGNGLVLPSVNDAKELVATCCDMAEAKGIRNPSPIFIDMPRAMGKERLYGIYSAIEQIKSGYLYDMRYKFHSYDIDSPAVWVFTNTVPDLTMLSLDRWNIFTIDDNNCLVEYETCLDE